MCIRDRLQDLLAYNQQQENQTEMDLIYERIEKAQNALEDNEGLLETYESHLQCKRSLDDRNGLIRILDALGTLHSKIGNSERSREFHAERLKLVSLGEKKRVGGFSNRNAESVDTPLWGHS